MPCAVLHTNVELARDQEEQLASDLSQAIADATGKPE
ncbi:hypothetical protein KIPB_015607, partial [Kipferlia bialata]|eukprot:g15607.t1